MRPICWPTVREAARATAWRNTARLTWRLLFLSTGEHSLEQHIAEAGQRIQAGQEVRLVDVPADAGTGYGLFEDLHASENGKAFADHLRGEATTHHYGHAGRAFVAALSQDRPERLTDVRQLRDGFVAQQYPVARVGQSVSCGQRLGLIWRRGRTGDRGSAYPAGLKRRTDGRRSVLQRLAAAAGGVGNAEEARALSQVRLFFERSPGRARFKP